MGKQKEICSCGMPQSFPIPHEHDRTERENQIINFYEKKIEELEEENQECSKNAMELAVELDENKKKVELGKVLVDKAVFLSDAQDNKIKELKSKFGASEK